MEVNTKSLPIVILSSSSPSTNTLMVPVGANTPSGPSTPVMVTVIVSLLP